MQAVVFREYGSPDVLKLEDVPQPTPGDDEVLVKVWAASVNAADWHFLRADPFLIRLVGGLLKPKNTILGADVAGRVEAVGGNVTALQPGDEVFGDVSACGWGGFAEFVCAGETALVRKPEGMSFEEAAAVPMAGMTALQGLRDGGRIQPGQKVLIHGASGGVGTFAVQIAKSFDTEVTDVCSTGKVEMVRSLGADHVIDYTQEDFTQNGQRYDLIIAANGNRSVFEYRRSLAPDGVCVMTGGTGGQIYQAMLLGPWISMMGRRKVKDLLMRPKHEDLVSLQGLLQAGKVVPVIDRSYPLSEVPDAIRYLEEGHARGKVVIRVMQESESEQ